jgi:hypothetical protein
MGDLSPSMDDTISKRRAIGVDVSGQLLYGSLETGIPAAVMRDKRTTPMMDGTMRVHNHQIVTYDITDDDDQIWTSDQDPAVDKAHRILSLKSASLPGDAQPVYLIEV